MEENGMNGTHTENQSEASLCTVVSYHHSTRCVPRCNVTCNLFRNVDVATFLTLQKVEINSNFLPTCNATFCCVASCKKVT